MVQFTHHWNGLLQRLGWGNRISSTGDTRTIKLGSENSSSFPDNEIVSSKYTVFTFIPKNLFEQFRRIANFYFLCMGIISLLIESPVSPATSILPLVFVVIVTAIKQAYEDFLRHRADKEVNNYLVTVVRNGSVQKIMSKSIQVGDIVRLDNEQDVPCDLVLLVSSHKESKCYVTTANLDGETNLKTLYCPKSLKRTLTAEELSTLDATIECESPSADLYKYHGRLEFGTKISTLLRQSMLLRQQSMRSLRSLVSFEGNRTSPILEEVETDRLRRSVSNIECCLPECTKCDRNNRSNFQTGKTSEDLEMRTMSCQCSCNINRRHSTPEDDAKRTLHDLEDIIKRVQDKAERRSSSLSDVKIQEATPVKNNSTPEIGKKQFGPQRVESIPKSAIKRHKKTDSNVSRVSFNVEPRTSTERRGSWNLDRKASLISHRQSSLLSIRRPSLATAEGGLADPLGSENLLLRGARLKNTDYVYGCAVYTGQDTKLALNSKVTSSKFSTIERAINKFLIFFLVVLVGEVILSTVLTITTETHPTYRSKLKYTDNEEYVVDFNSVAQAFFGFFVLYNYIIPISLYVTMELQKFLGTLFFEWDLTMYDDVTQQAAICNTSDLNEEMGQVEFLFTDKTGTLTENNMKFRRCSVNGVCYLEKDGELFQLPPDGSEKDLGDPVDLTSCEEDMEKLLLALTLCHTVQVVEGEGEEPELHYNSSSPDEKALVEAMRELDIVFANDEDELVALEIFGQEKLFRKLEILEFSSDRKRMSVIIEDEDGNIVLYCKGAESALIPLVTTGNSQQILDHVADFAKRGLRTLVVGYKTVTKEEYEKITIDIQRARQTLSSNRETVVAQTYQKVESGLTVLGATGVEDELQEGVQQTLEALRAAGIKVWILTGDKVETAENISLSCGHLKPGSTKLYLVEMKTAEACTELLTNHRSSVQGGSGNFGLIVDGQSLGLALAHEKEMFREVCMGCTAVVCCRMSPLQKSEVVSLIKKQKNPPVTAAVGDGANDVSMIQEAHVGLGIMGKEGRQAVRCSDFAFAKFRHLRPALLVHGHWYYLRVATLIQYFFYKNIAFITPQLYFLFLNGYSTQPLFDSMYLTCFNVVFTSLPILAYGLFEQDHSAEMLLKSPHLYSIHAKNALMTWAHFFKWFALGVWHSIVAFALPTFLFLDSPTCYPNGTPSDITVYGTSVFHISVVVVNLKLLLHSRYWSWIFIFTLAISLIGLLLLSVLYSVIYVQDITSPVYWGYIELISSVDYWVLLLVACVICLVPDILIDTLINTKFRSFRFKTIKRSKPNFQTKL